MTDRELGKKVREIADRGSTAEVKINKEGIVVLEVARKVIIKDNVMGGRGGSSGLSGNSTHDKNGLLKNISEYSGYDANKLSGTQKQKEYAQDIINAAFKNIENQIERIRREEGKLIESYPIRADSIRINANAAIQSYIDIKKVFVTSFNGKMNDAGKVIANKDKIKDALSPLRESLEAKYQKQYMDEYKKKHGYK